MIKLISMLYQVHFEQKLPISIEQAWDFLSDPTNLQKITPQFMGFEIIGKEPEKMYAGQIIQYKVSPLWNIPMRWVTEITHVNAPYYFVDEQRVGPYSIWHHQHHLEKIDGGVLMKDILSYQLPLGILGNVAHSVLIKSKIEAIFSYRKNKLEKLFGNLV
jgi:ligand-binding SRPBCC domain-containing protein